MLRFYLVWNWIDEVLMFDDEVSECSLFELAVLLTTRFRTVLTIAGDTVTAMTA
tara:strand:- start:413 stop:574 length:162 start_codon:yes stop_codon:yes gene_type:complete